MASDSSGSHAATSDNPILSAPASYEHTHLHRARRVLGLAFFVCAALLLTLTGCDSEAMLATDSSDRDTALRILQPDSRLLAFADVDNQMDTALRLMGEEGHQAMFEEGIERLYEMTGIRVDEDVHGIYMGMHDFAGNGRGGLVAFVDFNQENVASRAADLEEVVRVDTDWPVDAFMVNGRSHSPAIAFAEGSLVILASDADLLRGMLDRAYQQEESVAMDAMLAEVADRDSWFIARGISEFVDELPTSGGSSELAMVRPLLGGLQDIAFGMDQDGETMSSETIIRPSENVAVEDYESLLSGVRAMLRLQLRDYEMATEMINRIDIDAEDEWVSLKMTVDREEMERLQEEIREEMEGRFN